MYQRVKAHVIEHKTAYCCIVTGAVVAGITCLIMRDQSLLCGPGGQRGVADQASKAQVNIDSNFIRGNHNTINKTTIVNPVPRLSYIVEAEGIKEWFISQAELARELGYTEKQVSDYFNRDIPLPDGRELIRHGIAA